MTLHHHIAWTVETEHVGADFTCTAPVGAECRLICAEDCGADSLPCYSYDGDNNEREHATRDSGRCNVLAWLGEESAQDTYDPQAEPAPVRNGPVVIRWTGDELGACRWSYPPADGPGAP